MQPELSSDLADGEGVTGVRSPGDEPPRQVPEVPERKPIIEFFARRRGNRRADAGGDSGGR
jgi:hypothetical protein